MSLAPPPAPVATPSRAPVRAPRPPMVDGNLRLTVAAATATALGALALAPLFQGMSWYPPAVLAVVVVAAIGAAARRYRVPLPLHPVLQGLGLFVLLLLLYARRHLWAGIVPTPTSVSDLRAVVTSGISALDTLYPPVAPVAGIMVITLLGVGMAALLVDVFAVPLRMPLLAGVPLLAMYLVPAGVLHSETPWWCFVPGALGWLALLLTDSRESLLGWGRVLGRPRRLSPVSAADDPVGAPQEPASAVRYAESTRTPGLAAAARRIGFAAVALAVVLPVLVPGLTSPVLHGGGPGGSGGVLGSGDGAVTLNPLVSLKREYLEQSDRVILRYHTDDPTPDYLRMVALETFDGTTWGPVDFSRSKYAEVTAGLPPAVPGMTRQSEFPVRRYQVQIDQLNNRYLPLPYPPVTVAIGDGWFYDPRSRVVFSQDHSTLGAGYVATSIHPDWNAAQLRASSQGQPDALRDPSLAPLLDTSNVPISLATTAAQVTAGATSQYDRAVALQDWFRKNFTYSVSVVSGNDASYLEQFLRDRVGYCEQFAATMALMARTQGIPARVAVGFTQGTPTGGGNWQVTIREAHAWPELWITGAGWMRFEPTPRADAGVGVPSYATAATPPRGPSASPTSSAARPGGDPLAKDKQGDRLKDPTSAGSVTDEQSTSPWTRAAVAGVLGLLALVAAAPALVRRRRRARRLAADDPRRRAEGAWDELRDTTRDLGLPWSDADTPRQRGRALVAAAGLSPHEADAVGRLVAAAESARYARPAPTPAPAPRDPSTDTLAADVSTVRVGLRERCDRSTRWRALLLPRSVLTGRRRISALRDEGSTVTAPARELVGSGRR